jgi:hypothetical protein
MSYTTRLTPSDLRKLFFLALLISTNALASGVWTALNNAPPTSVNSALVLSDGTILTDDGSGDINRLTPDSHGSYINGTWTRLNPMINPRMFFSTEMMTNGNVFVAGGEYGVGGEHAEWFDPRRNVWTAIPDPIPAVSFSDSISGMLPNGNVFVAPVSEFGGCLIYNVSANTWQVAASTGNMDETCWVKLTNDCILGLETGSQTAVHYVPSSNQWISDNNVAVPVYGFGAELGPGFLLPNGKVFYIGGNTNTAIYTPGAAAAGPGTWVAGPVMVFGTNELGAVDAPAAMMNNGNILCALGPVGGFNSPISFYEYDYVANAFTQVNAPGGGLTYGGAPFGTSMLVLPDGTVLFVAGQNTTSLYVYTPDGSPLAAGQPVINSITENVDGSYHVTGTGLNGISAGAAYGDDEQMNSNYPLIRMTNNATGDVYYARTFNWSSTGVQTGSKILTTEFTLPAGLPAGTYSLVATANGNPSAPETFTYSPPPVPTGVTASSGNNGYSLVHWNASTGATAYNLKRSAIVNGFYTTIATTTGLSFTNSGLTNGLEYYYKVAAVGSGGPSGDSSYSGATPSGPTYIPGATTVSLSSFYNRTGICTDGRSFSGGFDGGGTAFSATFLEPSVLWNNLIFNFGPSNTSDVVSCTGQTVPLTSGHFNTLQVLAAGVNGAQQSQTFTVTYTDSSTATFAQSFSDWASAKGFSGEIPVVKMPYRVTSGGGTQSLNMAVDGYVFVLDQTKTVQSITLPNNGNLVLLSAMLANDPAPVSLSNFWNRAGLYTDGTTFTNPATGGADGDGYAYPASLLGTGQYWTNTLFEFPPANQTNVVSCAGQTVPLPPGGYSRLRILAAAVNGSQPGQSFIVTYSDATTATYSQGVSDWASPQGYFGETKAIYVSHRAQSDGSDNVGTFYLYGYNFTLSNSKMIQSVKLPNNNNVIVSAISLAPNWPPTFNVNPMTLPEASGGVAYSGTIATNATDIDGDGLTFGKVSGPAWLGVAANGALSGVPSNSDANTETFTVSVKDSGGLSNTATLYIYVNAAPYFVVNPFSPSMAAAGQEYSDTIATNAVDPNPGDVLTFAMTSGPAWLTVATNGALSGIPGSSDAGTNNFSVSVTDPGGLSGSANMSIFVNPAPPILPVASFQGGNLSLSWSGGVGPYQVQVSTDLVYGTWQTIGTISSNTLVVTPTNPAAFYRVVGN